MIGAIIGDIVGSIYEFNNHRSKDFPFCNDKAFKTDDTVLTVALMESLLKDEPYGKFIKEYYKKYPNESWGCYFQEWAENPDNNEPYNSFGNGSAMRVSPVAVWCDSEDDVLEKAKWSADFTHNHPEGVKGAQATALTIYWARLGKPLEQIRTDFAERWGEGGACLGDYQLTKSVDEIRKVYRFNELCQKTVPEAITCFVESTSFEDAIRNAISIGGDSDTIAAITGACAEAYYGVAEEISIYALNKLDDDLCNVVLDFYEHVNEKNL
jgi:ADP-ribosylglycohydrolase